LPAYQSGVKNREVSHPKFYFFDFGVARAAAGLTREHLDRMHLGVSFETLLLNEISAFISYRKKGYQLFYHAVSGGGDIDLVIQLSRKTVSKSDRLLLMEFKLSRSWDRRWSKELEEFSEKKGKSNIEQIIGVYTGDHRLKVGEVDVYPVDLFLQDLYDGKII
jgi:predicted AAA+ superfamily ATPase